MQMRKLRDFTGKDVVSVVTMSVEGDTAPSIPKAIDLTRLALKTVS